jgi:hypothetical protein
VEEGRQEVGLKSPILDKGSSAYEAKVAAVVASAAAACSRNIIFVANKGPRHASALLGSVD